jgi:hypothetical protein
MKSMLYQFLSQRTIITPEYTDLWNIVNRHALHTDGYQVLYEIMQRIHPALDPDSIFSPPESKDYSDVHEYYYFFDSYLMHEKHSGRHYSAREKVNMFLRGLDNVTYNSAITRIRQQMDSWKPTDNEGPDLLKLPKLPNLIEKYIEEAGNNHAVIHRAEHRVNNNNHKDTQGHLNKHIGTRKTDDECREYVDILCPLCHTHGHPQQHCDRMALWLHLKEAAKALNEKLRAKLIANYTVQDNKRRNRKLAKIRGTVRQLYETGDYDAGDQLLHNAMDKIQYCEEIDSQHAAESDQSTSS